MGKRKKVVKLRAAHQPKNNVTVKKKNFTDHEFYPRFVIFATVKFDETEANFLKMYLNLTHEISFLKIVQKYLPQKQKAF